MSSVAAISSHENRKRAKELTFFVLCTLCIIFTRGSEHFYYGSGRKISRLGTNWWHIRCDVWRGWWLNEIKIFSRSCTIWIKRTMSMRKDIWNVGSYQLISVIEAVPNIDVRFELARLPELLSSWSCRLFVWDSNPDTFGTRMQG